MDRHYTENGPIHSRQLFAVLGMLLCLGVGNVWALTETITLSDFGWSNASTQSSITATTATIALAKNSAGTAPTYYTADGLRIYGVKKGATTGGTISFTPKTGITISSIAFTHTISNGGYLAIKTGTGSYNSSTKTWSGTLTAGNTVSLVATNPSDNNNNPQVKITVITITYTSSAADPTLTVSDNATSLAIGDAKVNGSGVANSTLTFSGSNLTANATLSISGTNASMFTVSPTSVTPSSKTITNQTITVTYTPTSTGNHTATLTIASTGATSKTITLSGTGKYEVIWKNNGGDYTTTLVASGSRPTFPSNPTSCDAGEGASTTFYGWAANGSTWSGKINSLAGKTIHTSASTMPTVSANGTIYHAVFCKGGALTYATSLSANDVVYLATSTASGASGVTGANANGKDADVSTTQADWMPFTVQTNSTGWKLQNGTNYIQATAKNFAFTTSTPNVLTFAQDGSTGKYRMIFTSSGTNYALGDNNGSYWRFYATSNTYSWYYVLKAGAGTNYMTTCCTPLASINGSFF